jgi:hypothetical protein
MRYLVFSLGFLVICAVLHILSSPYGISDPVLVQSAASQGVGFGIGALLLGGIGLLYRPNRFRGFIFGSLLFGVAGLAHSYSQSYEYF